jgi:uncharacterized protein YkwD
MPKKIGLLYSLSIFACLITLVGVHNNSAYGQATNEKPVAKLIASYSEDSSLVATRSSASSSSSAVSSLSIVATDYEKKAFDLINQERIAKGAEPLRWDVDLCRMARMHSKNMAEKNFFAHTGPDGSVKDRAKECGVVGWKALGENIAFNLGYSDPAEFAVKGWKESPKHLDNLLRTVYTHSAIGVAVASDGSVYFTQVFAAR